MTCAVFEGIGQQVHAIDGADGGYALAAQALKTHMHATRPFPNVPRLPTLSTSLHHRMII